MKSNLFGGSLLREEIQSFIPLFTQTIRKINI